MGRHGHGGQDKIEDLGLSHWQLFVRTLPFMWPKDDWRTRSQVLLSLFFLLLAKMCELAVPYMLSIVIQNVSNEVAKPAEERSFSTLFWPILGYASFRLLSSLCGELKNTVFASVAALTERKVALNMFTHLQNLSLRFHLTRQTGAVIRSVSRGSSSFASVTKILLFQIMPIFVQVVIVCAYLFSRFSWYFAVVTFLTIGFYLLFTFTTTEWRNKFRREMNDADNEYNQKATDALLNFETVKYFNAEQHERARFDHSLQKYQRANIISYRSLSVLNGGQAIVITLGTLTAMLLAGKQVADGQLTVGEFLLINQFILTLYIPLGFLGTYYRMIKQSLLDVENMFALMKQEIEVKDPERPEQLPDVSGKIEFKNVSFSYNPSEPILRNVSFTVRPGQSVAIVGKTGAGKSTLARLLYRFYDIQSGSIKVDGVDVRELTQRNLRQHIAIVPQDCVLFNDTIGYNINYGRVGGAEHIDDVDLDNYSEEEVVAASKSASLHDFILTQKDQYDTKVGERGLRLSGGEKQRVAIARAILKRPKILVFDEATSSLDTHTEREIQAALDKVSKGRTTMTVAHRLSTIVNSDVIIVLKHGRIVEQGNHVELMSMGERGEYYQMWQKQQRDAKLQETMAQIKKELEEPDHDESESKSNADDDDADADELVEIVLDKPREQGGHKTSTSVEIEMQGYSNKQTKGRQKKGYALLAEDDSD